MRIADFEVDLGVDNQCFVARKGEVPSVHLSNIIMPGYTNTTDGTFYHIISISNCCHGLHKCGPSTTMGPA